MKNNKLKFLIFTISLAVFAFLVFFGVFAASVGDLPLPTGVRLPSQIAAGSAAVKQIYFLFQFGLGAIGIVAFGSIIYGAVRYMAAAGDPSAINEAKSRIYSALWGIGIALTSIILLSTINPDLVNFLATGQFNVPKIKYKQSCGGEKIGQCDKDQYCYLTLDGKSYQCMTPENFQNEINRINKKAEEEAKQQEFIEEEVE